MFTDAVDREHVDSFKDHGFVDITEERGWKNSDTKSLFWFETVNLERFIDSLFRNINHEPLDFYQFAAYLQLWPDNCPFETMIMMVYSKNMELFWQNS